MDERTSVRRQNTIDQGARPVPHALLQRKCACSQHTLGGAECASCASNRNIVLQRSPTDRDDRQNVPPIVYDVLGSPGEPLGKSPRSLMESRLGYDLSRVRVHTDSRAMESARAVNALAYAVGDHVVFGADGYAPGTHTGHRVLAHELAHVVQHPWQRLMATDG